jgi:hypothetical protein
VWEEGSLPPSPCVAGQERDISGDEAMFVLHQLSNFQSRTMYQGRPLGGCGWARVKFHEKRKARYVDGLTKFEKYKYGDYNTRMAQYWIRSSKRWTNKLLSIDSASRCGEWFGQIESSLESSAERRLRKPKRHIGGRTIRLSRDSSI